MFLKALGSRALALALGRGEPPSELAEERADEIQAFKTRRKRYLIYP